jgi:hypothetical protein
MEGPAFMACVRRIRGWRIQGADPRMSWDRRVACKQNFGVGAESSKFGGQRRIIKNSPIELLRRQQARILLLVSSTFNDFVHVKDVVGPVLRGR